MKPFHFISQALRKSVRLQSLRAQSLFGEYDPVFRQLLGSPVSELELDTFETNDKLSSRVSSRVSSSKDSQLSSLSTRKHSIKSSINAPVSKGSDPSSIRSSTTKYSQPSTPVSRPRYSTNIARRRMTFESSLASTSDSYGLFKYSASISTSTSEVSMVKSGGSLDSENEYFWESSAGIARNLTGWETASLESKSKNKQRKVSLRYHTVAGFGTKTDDQPMSSDQKQMWRDLLEKKRAQDVARSRMANRETDRRNARGMNSLTDVLGEEDAVSNLAKKEEGRQAQTGRKDNNTGIYSGWKDDIFRKHIDVEYKVELESSSSDLEDQDVGTPKSSFSSDEQEWEGRKGASYVDVGREDGEQDEREMDRFKKRPALLLGGFAKGTYEELESPSSREDSPKLDQSSDIELRGKTLQRVPSHKFVRRPSKRRIKQGHAGSKETLHKNLDIDIAGKDADDTATSKIIPDKEPKDDDKESSFKSIKSRDDRRKYLDADMESVSSDRSDVETKNFTEEKQADYPGRPTYSDITISSDTTFLSFETRTTGKDVSSTDTSFDTNRRDETTREKSKWSRHESHSESRKDRKIREWQTRKEIRKDETRQLDMEEEDTEPMKHPDEQRYKKRQQRYSERAQAHLKDDEERQSPDGSKDRERRRRQYQHSKEMERRYSDKMEDGRHLQHDSETDEKNADGYRGADEKRRGQHRQRKVRDRGHLDEAEDERQSYRSRENKEKEGSYLDADDDMRGGYQYRKIKDGRHLDDMEDENQRGGYQYRKIKDGRHLDDMEDENQRGGYQYRKIKDGRHLDDMEDENQRGGHQYRKIKDGRHLDDMEDENQRGRYQYRKIKDGRHLDDMEDENQRSGYQYRKIKDGRHLDDMEDENQPQSYLRGRGRDTGIVDGYHNADYDRRGGQRDKKVRERRHLDELDDGRDLQQYEESRERDKDERNVDEYRKIDDGRYRKRKYSNRGEDESLFQSYESSKYKANEYYYDDDDRRRSHQYRELRDKRYIDESEDLSQLKESYLENRDRYISEEYRDTQEDSGGRRRHRRVKDRRHLEESEDVEFYTRGDERDMNIDDEYRNVDEGREDEYRYRKTGVGKHIDRTEDKRQLQSYRLSRYSSMKIDEAFPDIDDDYERKDSSGKKTNTRQSSQPGSRPMSAKRPSKSKASRKPSRVRSARGESQIIPTLGMWYFLKEPGVMVCDHPVLGELRSVKRPQATLDGNTLSCNFFYPLLITK